MSLTITDLKKHLGPGLGLRKNKYLIEIPVPGVEGRTLNILCRSAGLPERNITTTSTFHKGRKYNMRSETDYTGTYEISVLDDSNMQIRKTFDGWMKRIDNSKPKNSGILGASFEGVFDEITALADLASEAQDAITNPTSFFMGLLDKGNANSTAPYQTDVNIWQLSGTGETVYGYKLQNCFPSQIGIVTLDDGEENTLSEFSVVLTYSEFIPLENISSLSQIGGALLGDSAVDAFAGVESLFD